jgi:hypothetical protein
MSPLSEKYKCVFPCVLYAIAVPSGSPGGETFGAEGQGGGGRGGGVGLVMGKKIE